MEPRSTLLHRAYTIQTLGGDFFFFFFIRGQSALYDNWRVRLILAENSPSAWKILKASQIICSNAFMTFLPSFFGPSSIPTCKMSNSCLLLTHFPPLAVT